MENICIKPYFSLIIHNENSVELRHGVWNSMSHMINDENEEGVLAKIMLGLNEKSSPSEIAKQLGVTRSKIESVLDYLQQLGVLQSKSESFIDCYINDLLPTLRRPGQFQYKASLPIVFIGDSCINKKIHDQLKNLLNVEMIHDSTLWSLIQKSGDDWLFDALEQQRFIEQFKPWQHKFIVFSSRYINPVHATRLNRIAYALNIPWLHLAIDGPFIFVGPTFNGQGACYDCFETRVGMNLRESESYRKYKNAIAENRVYFQEEDPLLSVTSNLLVSHAALEILNFQATQCTFTTNKILSIFLPTMEFVYHEVLRLPACRTCGSVSHRDDTQLYFDFQRLVTGAA